MDETRQVSCLTTKANFTLVFNPIEITNAAGLKIAVVPLSSTTAVVVELRQAIGYDKTIKKPGILVYLVDSSVASGYGPIKVLPINNSDLTKHNVTLGINQSLKYNNVGIYVGSVISRVTIVVT